MTVKTIKLKNIKDEEQLYVVIENHGAKEAISVGIKTFTRIEELLNSKPVTDGKDKPSGKMDK